MTLYEVKDKDVESWRKAIEGLKTFLEKVSKYIQLVAVEPVKRLELLADMISLYFKLPLIEEPLPTITYSPLKLYMISRWMTAPRISVEEWISDLYTYAENSIKAFDEFCKEKEGKEIFEIFDGELNKAVRKSWLFLPSDTRPGLNISSLIPHLLLTSSITWCESVNRRLEREEAAVLRIAALLHDVGKPFNYKEHYEVSSHIAEELTKQLPLQENHRNKIIKYVKEHHRDEKVPPLDLLVKADHFASAIDRITNIAKKLVGDRINELAAQFSLDPKNAYGVGARSWEFWRKIGEDAERFKILCEVFINKLRELSDKKEFKEIIAEERDEENVVRDVSLCYIDIGGIQDFIMRTRELRCVAASSLLVDYATVAYIPLLLQLELEREPKVWLPFESFLYNLGGVVLFVAPTKLADQLEQKWDAIRRRFEGYFDLYFAHTPLSTSYYKTYGRLYSEMALKKITSQPLRESARRLLQRSGARELCQKCYSEPAVKQTEFGEKFCELCSKLYELGSEMHFGKRWQSEFTVGGSQVKPEECFNIAYDELIKRQYDIMYFIAGHSREEIEGRERKRNIALIKVDGNLMGVFFAKSISIADAVERSARVDLALKEAFEDATSRILKAVSGVDGVTAKQTIAALKLGLLYMGGDDALIICPSWVALPLAVDIARAFNEKMGGECSLSVGLVAAPPEHDIWALIDASSQLLDEAKKIGRVKSSGGAICFDVVEGGILSGATAKGRYEDLKKLGLTAQPLTILKDHQTKWVSIDEVLETLGVGGELTNAYIQAFKASRLSGEDSEEIKKKLKQSKEAVRNSIKISGGFGKSSKVKVSLIFTQRMRVKGPSKEERESYRTLLKLFNAWFNAKDCGAGFPSSDVERAIKILGGGVI
ncbi:MAG: HD domain-containing protein [Thaumarchaeota archaeon]|nr:HD domain-containing protein [Nitrososphaerota archaeon]